MIIIFGKPGSGKTSVANAATNIVLQSSECHDNNNPADKSKKHYQPCINLDLDICIPTWMRENFSKGIYPSPDQRADFAESACDYVRTQIQAVRASGKEDASIYVIVAFSFVNNDLRDTFRSRFPYATWVLIDVSDELAQDRIDQRVDHFYKGTPVVKLEIAGAVDAEETETSKCTEDESSEWNFAPVNFHHIALDGRHSIEHNARQVADTLMELRAV